MREMRISDLIKELKQLKKEHGNIKVGHNGGTDDEGKKIWEGTGFQIFYINPEKQKVLWVG